MLHKIVGRAILPALSDDAFSASTSYSAIHGAAYGRLHGPSYWAAASPGDNNDWIQVDIGETTPIIAIATQGTQCGLDWTEHVTRYAIQYSIDGDNYETMPIDFNGNTRCGQVVRHDFSEAIMAGYVKIYPTEVHEWASMRFELYTSAGATLCSVYLRTVTAAQLTPTTVQPQNHADGC